MTGTIPYRFGECLEVENLKWSVDTMKVPAPLGAETSAQMYITILPKHGFNKGL